MSDNVKRGQLRGLPFFDDLPEVRCHRAIVISKHLIKGPLGLVRRLPSGLFALGGFGLVLLHFGLKISHHGTYSRNTHNLRWYLGMRRKDGQAKEISQPGWGRFYERRVELPARRDRALIARCQGTPLSARSTRRNARPPGGWLLNTSNASPRTAIRQR